MKFSSFLAIFLFVFLTSSQAQSLKLLKMTGDPDFNTSSGIGQYFSGHNYNNEVLYFMASYDGLVRSLWKTDGTPSGTIKVLNEPYYNAWQGIHYVKEGLILKDKSDKNIKFFNKSNESLTTLINIGGSDIKEITPTSDGYIILAKNDNDNLDVFKTNKTASGTSKIGSFDNYTYNLKMSSSGYGGVVFNDYSFSEYDHQWIDINNNQVSSLKDFVDQYYEIEKVKQAYIYEHLLMLFVVKDGFQKNIILDLKTNTVHPFEYMDEPIKYIHRGDNIFMVTKKEIIKINSLTFESKEIFGDMYSFSTVSEKGNFLYVVGKGWNPDAELYEIDLDNETSQKLEDTKIGTSFYNCKSTIFKDELYYTFRSDIDYNQYLGKYDFENNKTIIVDTVSIDNGALTIVNPLTIVNNILITSVFNKTIGHELYYLDETVDAINNETLTEVKIYPTIVTSEIHFDNIQKMGDISIFSLEGKKVLSDKSHSHSINVANLNNGPYIGTLQVKQKEYHFRFIKQ